MNELSPYDGHLVVQLFPFLHILDFVSSLQNVLKLIVLFSILLLYTILT